MQDGDHRRQSVNAGGPLQRMKGAEQSIDAAFIARAALEHQQVLARLADQLAGLDQELLDKFVPAHASSPGSIRPVMMATWRRRSASETGLRR